MRNRLFSYLLIHLNYANINKATLGWARNSLRLTDEGIPKKIINTVFCVSNVRAAK
jgi:hypothetical protein